MTAKTHRSRSPAPASGTARAFWVTGAARGEIRDVNPGQGQAAGDLGADAEPAGSQQLIEVETLYSAVSRGTESLVFLNRIPESEFQRMRAPFQRGEFPFPVCYGYSNVGCVVEGPSSLLGQAVFTLFPHQTRFRVPAEAVVPVPESVPAARAVLAANMETAINGLWDAEPRIGDRIAVVGCGVVGSLVAYLASRIPGSRVTAIDTDERRLALLDHLGVRFATRTQETDFDLVIHASGHPDGLRTALGLAGKEARIVEMSWYGDQEVNVPLGGRFHSQRLTIRSSQVGGINQAQTPRWDYRRRLGLALSLLADPALDALFSSESRFEDLPETMAWLCQPGNGELCHRVIYPGADNHS
ncbi:zinc-dependent alcohol dehydrogenase [Marinobacter salicampi]|uniref:zinc-dependent alcohol dehydrogenase n=1 Tax=Marinobacter salicampi TaxID=435907 RepID=UPI00140E68BA|nr:zinc-binding alcohol dehydrogenase [Marinobacter salicampi]